MHVVPLGFDVSFFDDGLDFAQIAKNLSIYAKTSNREFPN